MYSIKQSPEDFVVKEIIKYPKKDEGEYVCFNLKKKNYTTLRAVKTIADLLRIPLKRIGFAGAKDKIALTEQLITIAGIERKKIERLHIKDIELAFISYGDSPLSLGDNIGNEFTITIRNVETETIKEPGFFLNLFGEQRFSKNNAEIGKAIIKKDFKKAVELILENEREYRKELESQGSNYVAALLKLPKKILMLYIHSYQSELWNKTVEDLKDSYSREENNPKIPLIGFGTDLDDIKDPKIKESVEEIMKEEKITERDFIIRELQGLSPEGDDRLMFAEIKALKVLEENNDELNAGKKKIIVNFKLGKGSYATEALKEIIKSL